MEAGVPELAQRCVRLVRDQVALPAADAGADFILVHSKQKTPDEVLAFVAAWTTLAARAAS